MHCPFNWSLSSRVDYNCGVGLGGRGGRVLAASFHFICRAHNSLGASKTSQPVLFDTREEGKEGVSENSLI